MQAFDSISGIGTAHDAPTYRTTGTVEVMHRLIDQGLLGRGPVRIDLFCCLLRVWFVSDFEDKCQELEKWYRRAQLHQQAFAAGAVPKGERDPALLGLKRYLNLDARTRKRQVENTMCNAYAITQPGADEQVVRDRLSDVLATLFCLELGPALLVDCLVSLGEAVTAITSKMELMQLSMDSPKDRVQLLIKAIVQQNEAQPLTAQAPELAQALNGIRDPAKKQAGQRRRKVQEPPGAVVEEWGTSMDMQKQHRAKMAASERSRGPVDAPGVANGRVTKPGAKRRAANRKSAHHAEDAFEYPAVENQSVYGSGSLQHAAVPGHCGPTGLLRPGSSNTLLVSLSLPLQGSHSSCRSDT